MMFVDPTEEKQAEVIRDVAERIAKYDMDLVAILMLESSKPLAAVYAPMARFMVAPFLPVYGDQSMKIMAVFQNKRNVEKLIDLLEENSRLDAEKQKKEKGPGLIARFRQMLADRKKA